MLIFIGCNKSALLYVNKGKVYYKDSLVGEFSSVTENGFDIVDNVEIIDDNILKITRGFEALDDVDSIRLTLDFSHTSKYEYVMIPSVCYNGNEWGRGKEPKGFQTNGVWHTYSYRRTPIPGVTYSESEKYAVAMWGTLPSNEREAFSCSVMPDSASVTHSLIFPEEERPFTYVDKNVYGEEYCKIVSMRKGETQTMVAYLFVADKNEHSEPMALFLDKAWNLADKEYATVMPSDKIWEYGVRYAKESLWAEEEGYQGFSIGLVPDGENAWKQRPFMKYEIGWCGQNASFINTLLVDYIKNKKEDSKNKALAAIETWTSPCTQYENGFYVVNYDDILKKRENIVSDACNLGTAAYNFFETAELLEKCDLSDEAARVKKVALGICDFVKSDQLSSGIYGKGWNCLGECLYRDGTVGAFMIAPMLSAYKITGNKDYFDSALKAYNYYYSDFVKHGYTTAGALDTWCIDKESSMPMLRSSLMLYDVTGDSTYINNAEQISYYLSTWLWHYKANYESDGDMTKYEYNTFGATSVSVQHHHLDVYALLFVADWLRLAQITGKNIWHEKAMAIWTNGCQLISDGNIVVNGRLRPVGSQNEAFFNCRWGFGGLPGKSRINNWLVAWPCAFRLEILRKLNDWSILDAFIDDDKE